MFFRQTTSQIIALKIYTVYRYFYLLFMMPFNFILNYTQFLTLRIFLPHLAKTGF